MPRGGSRGAVTSKMECFVIIVNCFQTLTIITKQSILDAAAVRDKSLMPVTCYHANIGNYLIIRQNERYIIMIAQLRKMFCKIPVNTRATISIMLLC